MIRDWYPSQHCVEEDSHRNLSRCSLTCGRFQEQELCRLCNAGVLHPRGSEDEEARMMAVLDPIKLVIDNYPEGQIEYLDAPNNLENEELGSRQLPFAESFILSVMTLWKSRRRNISVCSRAMKCV